MRCRQLIDLGLESANGFYVCWQVSSGTRSMKMLLRLPIFLHLFMFVTFSMGCGIGTHIEIGKYQRCKWPGTLDSNSDSSSIDSDSHHNMILSTAPSHYYDSKLHSSGDKRYLIIWSEVDWTVFSMSSVLGIINNVMMLVLDKAKKDTLLNSFLWTILMWIREMKHPTIYYNGL